MSSSTPKMGLVVWSPDDNFSHVDLQTNWNDIDIHDHDQAAGRGVQIGPNGLASASVVTTKIADGNVTTQKLADNAVTGNKLLNGSVTAGKLASKIIGVGAMTTVPSCRLVRTTNQTVPSTLGGVMISFNSEIYDTDGMHSSATPTRISIHTPGIYLFNLRTVFQLPSSQTGDNVLVLAGFFLNGATYETGQSVFGPGTKNAFINVSLLRDCVAGDYMESNVLQDSGVNGTVVNGPFYTAMAAQWLAQHP